MFFLLSSLSLRCRSYMLACICNSGDTEYLTNLKNLKKNKNFEYFIFLLEYDKYKNTFFGSDH